MKKKNRCVPNRKYGKSQRVVFRLLKEVRKIKTYWSWSWSMRRGSRRKTSPASVRRSKRSVILR